MDYINLGKTGLKVSRICLGCMTYGAPATGELKPARGSCRSSRSIPGRSFNFWLATIRELHGSVNARACIGTNILDSCGLNLSRPFKAPA